MHGHGKLTWSSGACYQGDFFNGKFHGQGYLEDNHCLKVGLWKNGVLLGERKEIDNFGG